MKRLHFLCIASAFGSLLVAPRFVPAQEEGSARPIAGIDLGIAVPTTDKTWSRIKLGGAASPYFGYMFDNSFGIQANLHADVFTPDDDRGEPFNNNAIPHQGDVTTLLGLTAGPRLSLPWTNRFETYLTGQGGVFGGVSGRLKNDVDGGVSLGGGFDFYLTDQFALSAFGRWNYVFIEPDNGLTQTANIPSEAEAENIQFVTAGLGAKWDFRAPEAPPPPPVIAKAAPTPAPLPPPSKHKIVLRGVHFDFDKSNIRAVDRPVLDEAANTLKAQGDVEVVVEGHTDAKGTDAYNLKLSQRRAQSVKEYLSGRGIAARRMTVEAYGESRPVATNDTEEGRAQNRRVELNVKE